MRIIGGGWYGYYSCAPDVSTSMTQLICKGLDLVCFEIICRPTARDNAKDGWCPARGMGGFISVLSLLQKQPKKPDSKIGLKFSL